MQSESKKIAGVNVIFCSDKFLHSLNTKYLKHDTLTDIITFDYSESDNAISGDVFISIDRVKENAKKYKVFFPVELHRVIIHGFLHLAGYKDKHIDEKQVMTSKEDYYLSLQPKFFNLEY